MKLLLIILSSLFADANAQYAAGNYAEAVSLYEQQLELEQTPAAEIYYNLGNAYFKQEELAQAILCYERCLRLAPSMRDAKHNLAFAQSRIQDNIQDTNTFFIRNWLISFRNLMSESEWIVLSVVCFFLLLAMALLFALSREPHLRKTSFYIALVALIVTFIGVINAGRLHHRDSIREEAIITQGVVNAKSSPDRSGTDLFTIHEGTKVNIKEELGEWCRITVGNYVGWIKLSNLERI
ncbi:MAG: tetratricopeptide repeat protein [Paludibacteraceae bacterium]|nr:tetratricopeptide repeat protein [Paludibacteraceae bacterium]